MALSGTHQSVTLSDGSVMSNGVRYSPSGIRLDGGSSGSGSSARSVASSGSSGGSFGSSMANQLTQVMDQLYNITERNTARSEAQAAELRDWQERQNKLAMDFNSAEAQKNRDWQQMMSDTAHQREIRDLQAAGLNPILSASGGNGAAVTSGATASGVTSSGAKGEVDTSLDGALVNLMGAMWSAQTQLESQRINAQNNLAIAEKNNSTSQLVAEMYTQQSREASQLAAATGIEQSRISAAVSQAVARISAGASYYASDIAHQNAILNNETDIVLKQLDVAQKDRAMVADFVLGSMRSTLDFTASLRGQDVSANSALNVAKEQNYGKVFGWPRALSQDAPAAIGSLYDKYWRQPVNGAVNKIIDSAKWAYKQVYHK